MQMYLRASCPAVELILILFLTFKEYTDILLRETFTACEWKPPVNVFATLLQQRLPQEIQLIYKCKSNISFSTPKGVGVLFISYFLYILWS